MRKTFLVNLILQVALNLLIKPLYILGIDVNVQNIVGLQQYGFYASLLNLSLILQIVIDFGIQNFTSKNIANNPENISKYFYNLLILKGLLSIVYLVLTFFIALSLGYDFAQMKLLFLLSLVQILASFFLFFRANIAALGFFQQDSFLSIFDRLGLLLICSFLLFYQYFSSENGVWILAFSQICSMLFGCSVGLFLLRKKVVFDKFSFDFSLFKNIFSASIPFAMIALLMTLYTRSDSVMLERLLVDGKTEAGIYASAYRLLEALNALTLIFGSLLLPMFSKQIAAGEPVKKLLSLSLGLVTLGSMTAAFVIFYFKKEIILFLYHHDDFYMSKILGILIISYVPLAMMYVLGALATAKNLLRSMQWVFGTAAILNFILNFFLIKNLKAEGAAYATLFTQTYVIIGLILINFVFDENKKAIKN
jgi:O-antigen/teichoic acid export membrane protein